MIQIIKQVLLAGLFYILSLIISFTAISALSYYMEGIPISPHLDYFENIYLFIGITTGMLTMTFIQIYKKKSSHRHKSDEKEE